MSLKGLLYWLEKLDNNGDENTHKKEQKDEKKKVLLTELLKELKQLIF